MNWSFRQANFTRPSAKGFSVVELLVVVAIIAILATLVLVGYPTISQRAVVSSLKADLSKASKLIKLHPLGFGSGNFPLTISTDCSASPDSLTNLCLKAGGGNTYIVYSANNATTPKTFILIASNGNNVYKITENTEPTQLANSMQPGVTPGADIELHGAKANGGTGPGINSPMTNVWADTSGNGKNAWLSNFSGSPWIGTGTAVNPYALAFTGGDDYLYNTSMTMNKYSYTFEVWMRQTVKSPAYSRWLMNHANGGLSDWNGDGRMYALLWGVGGPGWSLVATTADLAEGALHHVVMTTSPTELKLYVDNVDIGSSSFAGFVPNDPGTTLAFASSGWVGDISVARVYAWPLSASQISANYNAGPDW